MIEETTPSATEGKERFVRTVEAESLRIPIVVLGALYLLTRLLVLNFNEAEFSDGYSYLNWFIGKAAIWHPAYPWLVTNAAKVLDPIVAGRLVSIFAGFFCIPSLMALARDLHGRSAAIFTGSLFIVAPLIVWTNSRVLSESLFLAFTLPAVLYLYRASKDISWFPFFVLFSGLASLTRPEGLIFVPPLLVLIAAVLYNRKNAVLIRSVPASIPWLLFVLWVASSPSHGYQSVANDNLQYFNLKNSAESLWRYLLFYPYTMSFPIFALAAAGLWSSRADFFNESRKRWLQFLLYVHAGWFLALGTHWAWTTRLLIVPSTLLLVEAGGALSRFRTGLPKAVWAVLFIGTLLTSGFFSATGLFLQKETFKDIKETALWVRDQHPGARVISDESLKVKYYLGYYPVMYGTNEEKASTIYSMADRGVRANDVLLLHSFYTPLAREIRILSEGYELKFLHTSSSQTRPILGGGLLETDETTNHPASVTDPFFTQRHHSIALKVLRSKREQRKEPESPAERGFSAIELLKSIEVAKSEKRDLLRVYLFQYFPRDVSSRDEDLLERAIAESERLPATRPEHFKRAMLYFFLALVKTTLLTHQTDSTEITATVESWKQAERHFHEAGDTGKILNPEIRKMLADADANRNGQLDREEIASILTARDFHFRQ